VDSVPGEAAGTESASTLTCGASDGSLDERVALMLMHRDAAAARVRGAKDLQGEAAGRNMAVPVNWRACMCWRGCVGSLTRRKLLMV
jgi:hypothetical protein